MKTYVFAIGTGMVLANTVAAQEPPKFFFEGDLVRSAGGQRQGPPCVMTSQFKRGEIVIFRVRLLDPKTGKSLDDKAVKKMDVQLSNGETVPISYKRHPNPPRPVEDYYWTGGWIVSDSQPTGSFAYKVVVTDLEGKTTAWAPFNIASTQLTIVE